jgi:hypothetical protein
MLITQSIPTSLVDIVIETQAELPGEADETPSVVGDSDPDFFAIEEQPLDSDDSILCMSFIAQDSNFTTSTSDSVSYVPVLAVSALTLMLKFDFLTNIEPALSCSETIDESHGDSFSCSSSIEDNFTLHDERLSIEPVTASDISFTAGYGSPHCLEWSTEPIEFDSVGDINQLAPVTEDTFTLHDESFSVIPVITPVVKIAAEYGSPCCLEWSFETSDAEGLEDTNQISPDTEEFKKDVSESSNSTINNETYRLEWSIESSNAEDVEDSNQLVPVAERNNKDVPESSISTASIDTHRLEWSVESSDAEFVEDTNQSAPVTEERNSDVPKSSISAASNECDNTPEQQVCFHLYTYMCYQTEDVTRSRFLCACPLTKITIASSLL